MITVFSDSRYKIQTKKVKKSTETYLNERGVGNTYNISIVFIGKRKMKLIASKYKHENVALPILSFLYDNTSIPTTEETVEPQTIELFICYPQAVLLAAEKEKSVYGLIEELIHHGIETATS